MIERLPAARKAFLALSLAILVLSIPSIGGIPFGDFLGLDLQNLHAYHSSEWRNAPYSVKGEVAGDYYGRDMIYPPLLYFSFSWLRLMPFSTANIIWALVSIFGIWSCTYLFATHGASRLRPAAGAALATLFTLQFPALFSIERGNNDVVVLVLWASACFAFVNRRVILTGIFAGLSAHYKVYPAIAVFVLLSALFLVTKSGSTGKRIWIHYSAGVLMGFVIGAVPFFEMFKVFIARILPDIAVDTYSLTEYSHSLRRLFPRTSHAVRVAGYAAAFSMGIILIAAWIRRSFKDLEIDPGFIFAGALAISTYFSGISFDYNLITTYPLLALLAGKALRSRGKTGNVDALVFLLGLVSIIGHRGLFASSQMLMKFHVVLQYAWLLITPIAASRAINGGSLIGKGVPQP